VNKKKSFDSLRKAAVFYGVYTVIFLIMVYGVFYPFFANNVSFINTADAFRQHIKALAYYAKWLRGAIYHIAVEHSFDLQTFSFGMGYGTDIYPTLQYYAIGDLLNIPAAFVPNKYIYIYFQVAMMLRPYIAGIAFSALCFYLKPQGSKIGVMAGMFTYSFCTFFMFLGIWHPYFANPLIYFPLVILGAEKILRENKSVFFAVAIFLAGSNNFFFFYMIVLLTVVYVIVRTAFTYGTQWKKWGELIVKFFISGIIGSLMAMVILLPVIFAFPANPRTDTGITFSLFYDKDYYQQLVRNIFSFVYHGYYDTQIGYHGIILIALFMLVIKVILDLLKKRDKEEAKKDLQLFVLLLILTLFVCIPAAGYALTAFAYVINRWTFAFALCAAYILFDVWDDMFKMSHRRIGAMLVIAVGFYFICRFAGAFEYENAVAEFIIMVLGLVVVEACGIIRSLSKDRDGKLVKVSKKAGEVLITAMCLVGILLNGYYAYSPEKGNMIGEYFNDVDTDSMHILLESTEVQVVKEAVESIGNDPNGFYRYTGRDLVWNASLIEGISSTQFYWSLANGVVSDYFKEMGNNDQQNFAYYALDDRAILNTLAGVKYYTLRYNTDEEIRFVPYGFTHLYDKYNFAVYKNETPLSLGYAYYNVIPKNEYDSMKPVERQEALLYGIVLDEDDNSYPEAEPQFSAVSLPFEVECEGEVTAEEGKWVAKAGSSLHIKFQGMENCETYLWIDDLYVRAENDYPLLNVDALSNGDIVTTKQIYYKSEENQFYSDWHDYILNMGYAQTAKDEIVIDFTVSGTYTFDELGIYCQPLVNYETRVQELRRDMLENIELNKNPISYATNEVNGFITMEDDGIMCLTIPYSKGWTAYVDGEKTEISKANTMFMALKLTEGGHEIRLKYHTPGLLLGLFMSLAGVVLLVVLIRYEKKAGQGR
jgi:uncharacterized membrane protein YfhO